MRLRRRAGKARDGPEQAAQRNLGIVGAHQRGAAEGQRNFLEAVDDAVDDAGVVDVGDGDGVDGQQGDAQGAVFDGNGEDIDVAIAFDRARVLPQILRQLDLVVVADEDLGVASCGARCADLGGAAMHGHGGLVEIALKGEAGVLDEFVVAGSELGQRLLIEGGEAAHGAEVDVNHGIGFGQQARGLRGGLLAQQHHEADGGDKQQHTERDDEDAAAGSHDGMARRKRMRSRGCAAGVGKGRLEWSCRRTLPSPVLVATRKLFR